MGLGGRRGRGSGDFVRIRGRRGRGSGDLVGLGEEEGGVGEI